MISVYGGCPLKSVCVQFLAGKQDCQQFPFYFERQKITGDGNTTRVSTGDAALDSTAMNNSSEPNPATTGSLIKKLGYNSKKSTFTWRSSFDELKIFCFELLEK